MFYTFICTALHYFCMRSGFIVAAASLLVAGLVVVGGADTDAWAAQLDATLNPNNEESPFKMSYLKTYSIWYQDGGMIADELRGEELLVTAEYDSAHPDVRSLMERLNDQIVQRGSQASISDMTVSYSFGLSGGQDRASIDYKIILQGSLTDYIIIKDTQKTLVDLGWRALSVDGSVMMEGQEINDPFTFIEENMPVTAGTISGTEADRIFDDYLINSDFVLEQPLENWHFLFDPTGINVDAGTFGLTDDIAGFVRSIWTMGESNLDQGRQVERIEEEVVMVDREYIVRSTVAPDQGNLALIGFGVIDTLDGVEIAGVTPTAPEGYGNTATGDFPIFIIYGMAGLAAVAGIAFFFVSNRSLKNEATSQQGIDPSQLVGYQTSSASGGYQTNRGEAQLRSDVDYQQTRSYYESQQPQPQQESPPDASDTREDAACGCHASAEMGSECDCGMQGSCICDNTCQCVLVLCRDTAAGME